MWGLIFTAGAVIVLALFPAVRCAVFHPLHVLYYGTLDTFDYIRRKQYNLCHTGDLDIYCGYFGSGKTLSLVHKVTGLYEHYDGKTVWCPRRKKFVTQRVLILSNVRLPSRMSLCAVWRRSWPPAKSIRTTTTSTTR